MKLSLRKVSSNASLSQETNAFTAEIVIDDLPVAHVRNDGGGGCNDVRVFRDNEGKRNEACFLRLEAYEKWLKLQPIEKFESGGCVLEIQPDLDLKVDTALETYFIDRDLKRKMARYRLTYKPVGKLATVLNEMPYGLALDLFRAGKDLYQQKLR